MTDSPVDVVLHAPFVLEPSAWKPQGGLTQGESEDLRPWRLPLYRYSKALSASLQDVLPRCVAARDVTPEGGVSDVDDVTVLDQPGTFRVSMTLWKPDVLLVTQQVRLSLLDDANQYRKLNKYARNCTRPLADLAGDTCDRLQFVPEPLWVTATGFRERQPPAGTPRPNVGALDVWFHELAAVASHPDPFLGDKDLREHRRQFEVLMAVQQVLWAAAVDLDRSLLTRLDTMGADVETDPLGKVEMELSALVGVSHRITALRAQHATTEGHLGREAAARFWAGMEQEWKLGEYLKALGEKMSGLYHLHSEIAAAVNARRARRLGRTAFAFTALGVVTVGLAIVGYATTNLTKVPEAPLAGWGLLLVFVIAAVAIFRFGLKEEVFAWPRFRSWNDTSGAQDRAARSDQS